MDSNLAISYSTWPLYYDEWHLQQVHCWKRPHSSIDNQDTRSREISLTLIILVDMNSQQEGFHIDVGCYSPPTATDAAIIGANGLDPLWVQPSSNHYDGTSFDLPLGLETITSPKVALSSSWHYLSWLIVVGIILADSFWHNNKWVLKSSVTVISAQHKVKKFRSEAIRVICLWIYNET